MFEATWKTFHTRFSGIIGNFRRHKLLIMNQANLVQFDEIMQARTTAAKAFNIFTEGEKRRKRTAVRSWLAAANSLEDHMQYKSSRDILPRTGHWILKRPHLKSWLNTVDTLTPSVWLTGIPGSGKSKIHLMLARRRL